MHITSFILFYAQLMLCFIESKGEKVIINVQLMNGVYIV